MSDTPTLRLPTRAEIKASRTTKEAEAKVFREETLPAAWKKEILHYYCAEALKQLEAGAHYILVPDKFSGCRRNIIAQFQTTFDSLERAIPLTFDDLVTEVYQTHRGKIPGWVKEIPGFEDYTLGGDLTLKSKT